MLSGVLLYEQLGRRLCVCRVRSTQLGLLGAHNLVAYKSLVSHRNGIQHCTYGAYGSVATPPSRLRRLFIHSVLLLVTIVYS